MKWNWSEFWKLIKVHLFCWYEWNHVVSIIFRKLHLPCDSMTMVNFQKDSCSLQLLIFNNFIVFYLLFIILNFNKWLHMCYFVYKCTHMHIHMLLSYTQCRYFLQVLSFLWLKLLTYIHILIVMWSLESDKFPKY